MQYSTHFVAATYDCGAYGASSYETGACQTTGGGKLTNTGLDIALVVTIACAIALIAVLVRFWKRPAKKSNKP